MSAGEIAVSRDGSKLVLSFLMPGEATQATLPFECGSECAARLQRWLDGDQTYVPEEAIAAERIEGNG